MAVAFVQTANNSSTTNQVIVTITTSASNIVYVATALDGTRTVSSITDTGGSAYTKHNSRSNGVYSSGIWSAYNVAASTSVTINLSAAGNNAVVVGEYSGGAMRGATARASGLTADPTVSVTTIDRNNWVVASFETSDGTAPTAKTGNLRGTSVIGTAVGCALNDNTAAAPGAVTNAVTHAASTWACCGSEVRTTATASSYQLTRSGGMIGKKFV